VRYEPRAGTVQHGMKLRLYPRGSSKGAEAEWERQTRAFGRWSARARELWNLLRRLQMAAYSGANDMPHLRWRAIWVSVAQENYRLACERYEEEYPGCLANPPPPPDPMPILLERMTGLLGAELAASEIEAFAKLAMEAIASETRKAAEAALGERIAAHAAHAAPTAGLAGYPTPKAARALVKQLRQMAKAAVKEARENAPRQPPVPPDIDRMLARNLTRPDGTFTEPCLFIWENDCQKLMALLKKVAHTRWIADLPSHACQHVVKDLCKALRDVSAGKGFPAFKRPTPDGESVYFANTQLLWDIAGKRVHFPADLGWVNFEGGRAPERLRLIAGQTLAPKEGDETLARTGEDKFLGARLWRRAGRWWLSPQFETTAKPVPAFTGRHVAVKVGGAILATVYDGVTFKEFKTPASPRHRHADLERRSRSRSINAMAARKRKVTLRAGRRRKAKGLEALPRPARLRRPHELVATNAAISRAEEADANRRNDHQHKLSHRIVRMGDSLTIERLDVKGMMRKEQDPAKRREQTRQRRLAREGKVADPQDTVHKAPPKVLRKAVRRAAPARFLTFLKYKAQEAARPVNEQHEADPRVIKCGASIGQGKRKGETCGHLNYVMKDGRQLHTCGACGALMRRNINAVENIYEGGRLSRESGLEAAE
jgi:transposase